MRPLTDDELITIASDLGALVGAQLQESMLTPTELGLGFYHDRKMVWLWFDMDLRSPVLLRFEGAPPVKSKLTKPLVLFARAHLVGRRLLSVAMNSAIGRVLEFEFHDPGGEPRRLEARLFPHGCNLTIFSGEKSVSFYKPKDLPEKPGVLEGRKDDARAPRAWTEIRDEWLAQRGLVRGGAKPARAVAVEPGQAMAAPVVGQSAGKDESIFEERARKEWEKLCSKKAQALVKITEDLKAKEDPLWRKVGEWLKEHASLEAPEEFRERLDLRRSLSWNIENCFAKAKENERKIAGTRERFAILESELISLRAKGPEAFMREMNKRLSQAAARGSVNRESLPSLLEKAGARGRKLQLAENLEAYIGKSAADNMALLRRAQPHDLWLHLRDYPGAHAILRRVKGRVVTDAELNEAGQWVTMQSLKKNSAELSGGKYDMIVAECRHVKPIKGDKLGRVHYHDDRLFVVRF